MDNNNFRRFESAFVATAGARSKEENPHHDGKSLGGKHMAVMALENH